MLCDIIVISVHAIIAGADGPTDIFEWGELHEAELIVLLELEKGIPSKDTIRRTLQAIKPQGFCLQ